MINDLSQLVLGQENDGLGGIIQLLIFVFFIVAGIIKSLFSAKQEQKQNNKKRPVKRPISPKSADTAEKIRIQRERYEQFLENILQPKKAQQQQSSKPAPPRPHATGTGNVPISRKAPPGPQQKAYTNRPAGSEPYRNIPPKITPSKPEHVIDKRGYELPAIDAKLHELQKLKEEHIQEDQQHLMYHDRPRKRRAAPIIDSTEPAFAFEGSDDLKKAILYTEILGKPISMRETEALFD